MRVSPSDDHASLPSFSGERQGGSKVFSQGNGKDIALLGLGNILLGDEGVGVHALGMLKDRFDFPDNIEIIDGGTMGLDLLPFIEGRDKLLILDAVNLGKEPGTICIIEDCDIPSFISTKLSIHQVGLPDVIYALRLLGRVPPRMTLVGIQPETIESGLAMSMSIRNNLEEMLAAAAQKLSEWGVVLKEKAA